MNNPISFFPTIGNEELDIIDPTVNYSFYYINSNNEKTIIPINIQNNIINLDIDNINWDPYNYDLNLTATIEYKNGLSLYGKNGIAPTNSTLSICLEWFSQKARQRDIIISNTHILKDTERHQECFNLTFPKNTFIDNIEINFLTFLAKKDIQLKKEEKFLNNTEGVILGSLDSKTLFMTGVGSLFPIYTKFLPGKNLWNLDISISNPHEDKLSDCMKLTLNTAHKDYKYLNPKDPKYCKRLIFEIVANSVATLIFNLKNDDYTTPESLDQPSEDGSVIQFLNYYKNILELDLDSDDFQSISSSIRSYLDEKGD